METQVFPKIPLKPWVFGVGGRSWRFPVRPESRTSPVASAGGLLIEPTIRGSVHFFVRLGTPFVFHLLKTYF